MLASICVTYLFLLANPQRMETSTRLHPPKDNPVLPGTQQQLGKVVISVQKTYGSVLYVFWWMGFLLSIERISKFA